MEGLTTECRLPDNMCFLMNINHAFLQRMRNLWDVWWQATELIFLMRSLPCGLWHAQKVYTGVCTWTHTHTHTHTRAGERLPKQTCSQIACPFALMFQSSAMSISILSLIKFHLDERLYKGQEENSTHFSCVCVLMRSFIRYNQKWGWRKERCQVTSEFPSIKIAC